MKTEEREQIENALQKFKITSLFDAGINLFNTLGYNTEIQAPLQNKTYKEFNELFISQSNKTFNTQKALVSDWVSIDLLFQLTDDSFSNQEQLFDSTLNPNQMQSYLCFAVELKNDEYKKSEISQITREINKIFVSPIIIIFKYGKYVSLSIINRRLNKKDSSKDVLEKVTLIKDINTEKPHRAHIEILLDMSLQYLNAKAETYVTSFETLHKAWSKVLDIQLLNKRFYAELSDWYFWANKVVLFPGYELEADPDGLFTTNDKKREHNAKNLIRLLTRILFVWFIKEKELIPEQIFDIKEINKIISDFVPDYAQTVTNKSIYYKAILQNLFFASLNAEQGKREFRKDGQNQNATTLMRYKKYHKNPELFIQMIEEKVPFMNGGLFECLDKPDEEKKGRQGGAIINYEDGFSDRPDNELYVPDFIFFAQNIKVDLSSEYDDNTKKSTTVNGLINILQSYKFTITENTPIDEDIALDPELLGRVFENLLASYNPETKASARKQTGSFYTPREIVDYMIDESLKSFLKNKLSKNTEEPEDKINTKLALLIDYNEAELNFPEQEKREILQYLDECKVLDPACGSGAFPMGLLQKMVYIIHKLDPQNDNWKIIQIEKIIKDEKIPANEKTTLINDITSIFEQNDLDYARKLYLIENCIHGIDIQPVATQISRLRFFISLIVDQKIDRTKENFGIRPLPNLENRFVTANSLIGIDKSGVLIPNSVVDLQDDLKTIRHNLFNAKTPKTKNKLREDDKQIRLQIKEELEQVGMNKDIAGTLSSWDPYNKNATTDFFDADWMFGITDGFDIVIGNPPYVSAPTQIASKALNYQREKIIDSKRYNSLYQKWDLYIVFIELGLQLTHKNGIVSMIVPYPLTNQLYEKKLRDMITNNYCLLELTDLNGTKIFDNATVSNCIPFIKNSAPQQIVKISNIYDNKEIKVVFEKPIAELVQDQKTSVWNLTQEKRETTRHADMNVLGDFCYISYGLRPNSDEKTAKGEFKKEDLISEVEDKIHPKKYIEAKDIAKYQINRIRYLEYGTSRSPSKLVRPTFPQFYEHEKIVFNRLGDLYGYIVKEDFLHNDSIIGGVLWCDLSNVDNKSITSSIKKFSKLSRSQMENLSSQISLKYILGIMNSKYASVLLNNLRAGDYHIYPEHIRNIPIPLATQAKQQEIAERIDQILAIRRGKEIPKQVRNDGKAQTRNDGEAQVQGNNAPQVRNDGGAKACNDGKAQTDTSLLEHEIDLLVYALYGLTEEEIAIIENSKII